MSKNTDMDLLQQNLQIQVDALDKHTEDEIIQLIANRVAALMDANPDLLFSSLYRLDVEETKIKEALISSTDLANVVIAKLIWERQKQRIESKKKYKSPPID